MKLTASKNTVISNSDLHRLASRLCWAVLSGLLIAAAQRVEPRHGPISQSDNTGRELRLTEGETDSEPVLSARGDEVVYIRSHPSKEAADERAISEIRVHNLRAGTDAAVLNAPVVIDGKKYFAFGSPRFSPDAKRIYFLFNWNVATHGLAVLDRSAHIVNYLMPAVSFPAVVERGEYAGDLVVLQRRAKLGLGNYMLYYLFEPDGKEIGVVGDTEFDVELFLDPDGDVK